MGEIIPAASAITAVCDGLDNVIARFLDARGTLPPVGKFEAHIESMNLMYLTIRHVEGVIELARRDLAFAPAGTVLARAALETAVKAAWMINADDPFEREARWLVHLAEEERLHRRVAKHLQNAGESTRASHDAAEAIKQFREGVIALMPPAIPVLKRNPTFEEMLSDLSAPDLSLAYMWFSQFAHGTHAATGTYRRGLGTMKEFGEFITPAMWYQPLRVSWLSLARPGWLILRRLGGKPEAFLEQQDAIRFEEQIAAITTDPVVH